MQGVRQLPDGELLVSVGNSAGVPGSLWKSTDYPTLGAAATWAEVLTAAHDQASFSHVWGVHSAGSIITACEYGGKTPPTAASKAYVSTDNGDTWREIYDGGQVAGLHLHGIAYDVWWDRIWIVQGDDNNKKVVYSDNWRDVTPTWTTEYTGSLLLGVLPLAGAVCFHTDDGPAGVYNLVRTGFRRNLPMALAIEVGATFTHLGTQTYHRGTGYPGLFAFRATPGVPGNGVLVASWDGLDFYEIWRDNLAPHEGGLYRIVGPTDTGKLIGTNSDSRNAPFSRLVVDAPTWAQS